MADKELIPTDRGFKSFRPDDQPFLIEVDYAGIAQALGLKDEEIAWDIQPGEGGRYLIGEPK
jgi:hypothetical protein